MVAYLFRKVGECVLYYVGYYSCDLIRGEQRIVAPAAESKMEYIIQALSQTTDEAFEVVSPAQTSARCFFKGKKQEIQDRVFLKTFPSFNSKSKPLRVLGHFLTRLAFFVYLLVHIKREDHLLVYHSLAYMNTIKHIQKLKKCKLTIEVEELYSDVAGNTERRKKEIAYLQNAHSYIFVTDLLRNEVNTKKECAISHGTYRALPDYGFRFDDDRIHVVYAGTFRKVKGGAYTAIEAARHLDDRYTLEVLGGGSEEENAAIEALIREVSQTTDCKIRYVGFKSGQDFNAYIQACHIGLSTPSADAAFNATSFPSKVLMYMSNGLRVVSVRIPAVETSEIGKYINYYDSQDPKAVADAIRAVALGTDYDSRKLLRDLHCTFVERLQMLLRE